MPPPPLPHPESSRVRKARELRRQKVMVFPLMGEVCGGRCKIQEPREKKR